MADVVKTVIQFRKGLASAWRESNYRLDSGEPGWAIDTHILKIGDGVTPWNQLDAIQGEVSESKIEEVLKNYFEQHPIEINVDATLSIEGAAADAAAVRKNCLFNSDQLILSAGDADNNIFNVKENNNE